MPLLYLTPVDHLLLFTRAPKINNMLANNPKTCPFFKVQIPVRVPNAENAKTMIWFDKVYGLVDKVYGLVDKVYGLVDKLHGFVDKVHGFVDKALA